MSRTDQRNCHRSPDGRHDLVEGAVAVCCRHCWVIPTYSATKGSEAVTVNGAPRAKPTAKRVASAPKGTARLNKVRTLIERDGLRCFYCEHDLDDPETAHEFDQWRPTLDHLLPRSRGGNNAIENLVLACERCNSRKGDHVLLLAEAIARLRHRLDIALAQNESSHAFIEHLQWELFDAGLGELPGRTTLTRRRSPGLKRPKPRFADVALITELGDRACANLRAENSGGPHGRTASVVKRGRLLARRELVGAAP